MNILVADFHARVLAGDGQVELVCLRPCLSCGRAFDPRLDHDGTRKHGGKPRRYCSVRCRARTARSLARILEVSQVSHLGHLGAQDALPGLADVA